ncbi:MAG: hypothetical protein R2837_01395 [Aliarcobacter sp.]
MIKDERKVIYSTKEVVPCCNISKNIKEKCRAERTNTIVASENFPEICRLAICPNN